MSRILLVDDDPHLLITLSDYLSYEGFDVTRAQSGEEALERLETAMPDLIVLDISMPGMGGLGFLKRISEGNGRLQYPVLVLTARSAMEDFFGSVAVQGFLPKPCSEQELVEKIRAIIAERAVNAPSPASQSLHILLAEDDPVMAGRIDKTFREKWPSCEVATVSSGPEILEKALSFAPQIVLIKQVLRGMNGAEAAALLGMLPRTGSLPVILYSEDGEADRGKASVSRSSSRRIRTLTRADPWTLQQTAEDILRRGPE